MPGNAAGQNQILMRTLSIIFVVCLFAACSQNEFQTILYNSEYVATNESTVLTVDANVGVIPIDSSGRPNKDFRMDLYEYPNHPADSDADDQGFLPQINVTWFDAQAICQSHGKRLCTIYEFRETCYSDGTGKRKPDSPATETWNYPYPAEYNTDLCVTETSSAATVGSRPGCVTSLLGPLIADLSGNVWEWVNHDFYGQGSQFEGQQAVVGGYYFSGASATCGQTLIMPTSTKSDKVGFRCCRDKDGTP